MRTWAAPQPSRCRPCPAMRRDTGRPTATATSMPVSLHTNTHTHTHKRITAALIAPSPPHLLPPPLIYRLCCDFEASGTEFTSPFLANHYCQREVFMGAVNMDASCERGRKSLTPRSSTPSHVFFSIYFHFVSEGSGNQSFGRPACCRSTHYFSG